MTQTSSVALVGCGQWGRNIARVLAELGALRVICDADTRSVPTLAKELNAEFTTDLASVLARQDITAVAIATPAVTHAAVARQVIAAGKDVYLEKPIAMSTGDARELAKLAAAGSRVLMVGHLLQYHPGFVKLLETVRSGALGRITYVYSHRLNQGRVRTEENALWSLAPHDFSMVLAIAGQAPDAVSASSASIVQPGIPDIATAHLSFPNGCKGHIFCSWLNAFKEHRLTVIGDQAMAVFDDTPRLWPEKSLKIFKHHVEHKNGIPEFVKGDEVNVPFPAEEPLKNEMAHFLECVVKRTTPRTGADEAIPVLEALEKAQSAMESSQT